MKTVKTQYLDALIELDLDPKYYDEIVSNLFPEGVSASVESIENYADFSFQYGYSLGYITAVLERALRNHETELLLSPETTHHILTVVKMKGLTCHA